MDKEIFTFAYTNNFGGESYTHSIEGDAPTAIEVYGHFLTWMKTVYGWDVEEHIIRMYDEEFPKD